MVAKSLTKLIDEAIVPAITLICGKMLGLFLATYFLKLPFTIQNSSFLKILPTIHFANLADYLIAENYSNLAMFGVAAVGTVYVLIRAHFFHESHIHPNLHAKLASRGLEWLVAPSYHLYHQAAIWLIFLWLTVGFLVLSSIQEITNPALAIIALVVTANFSWVLALDVERELEIARETQ